MGWGILQDLREGRNKEIGRAVKEHTKYTRGTGKVNSVRWRRYTLAKEKLDLLLKESSQLDFDDASLTRFVSLTTELIDL